MSLDEFRAEFSLRSRIFTTAHAACADGPTRRVFHSSFRQSQDSVRNCRMRAISSNFAARRSYRLSFEHGASRSFHDAMPGHGFDAYLDNPTRTFGTSGKKSTKSSPKIIARGRDAVHRRHAARHRNRASRRRHSCAVLTATTRWSSCARRSRI